jgi:serine/threonine protein kinase/Flp pilus assembly protein TadD
MIGGQISHYKIVDKIGEGGMGEVYLAEDLKLERKVAIKFLPEHLTKNKDNVKRFEREAKTAASLNHPNIVTIHEISEENDQIFIVMEYVEGKSLRDVMNEYKMGMDKIIDIITQISEGLLKAHKAGIVHRDIKPENIIIDKDARIKILDFGLARLPGQTRLTTENTTMGTVAYMSPEQARGEEVDHRTDIWSLGILLFEMISEQLPFKSDYDQAIIYSIINEQPVSLSDFRPVVSPELEQIVTKALEKNPDKRYNSMEELLWDLRSIRDHKSSIKIEILSRFNAAKKLKNIIISIAIIGLAIILIIAGIHLFSNREDPINSIAILPFENTANNPELEYLCDGIPDNIISSLSNLPNLKVISSASVRRYKGIEINPKTVAEELKVRSVLLGRLLQPEDKLSIRVELIDTRDNRQLWGKQYDQELIKILTVQRDISNKISENLRLKLSVADKNKLEKIYTNESKAYQAYLKGTYHWQKFTVEGFSKSIEYFIQALQIDPNYVLAYVGLAFSYTSLGSFHGEMIPKEAIKKAKESAHKALELDNDIGEAHSALGFIEMFYNWDWSRAEEEFLRGIELSPNSALTRQHYGVFLGIMGRTEESIVQIKHAVELNPLAPKVYDDLALSYLDLNQYDKAIEQWKLALDLDPTFFSARKGLGLAYLFLGWDDKALEEFRTAVAHSNDHHRYLGYLGWALGRAGYRRKALDILKQIQLKYKSIRIIAVDIANIYIGLGEKSKALDWLEKAYSEGASGLILIYVDPYYRDLREEPRFKELLKKMEFVN